MADVIEKIIATTSQTDALKPGDVLFRECDEPEGTYIVKRGRFSIFTGSTPLGTVREGGLVGEMATVEENSPRSTTVIASTIVNWFSSYTALRRIKGEYLAETSHTMASNR